MLLEIMSAWTLVTVDNLKFYAKDIPAVNQCISTLGKDRLKVTQRIKRFTVDWKYNYAYPKPNYDEVKGRIV